MNWLPDRPWLRTLALAGTVVAAVFLLWQSDEPPVIDDEAAALRGDAEPDGFVVNGRYTSFDESGNLKIRFSSPRIEQFEEGNLATMDSPVPNSMAATAPYPGLLKPRMAACYRTRIWCT